MIQQPQSAELVELEKILSSPRFANSPRLSRFLSFIVEHALAGRTAMLKESVIAIEVYERGSDYDPSKDSTVRAEASRLRRVLTDYYDGLDAPSPLRIEVPKGSYVPIFVAFVAASPTPVLVPEAITPPIPAQRRPKWVVLVPIRRAVKAAAATNQHSTPATGKPGSYPAGKPSAFHRLHRRRPPLANSPG